MIGKKAVCPVTGVTVKIPLAQCIGLKPSVAVYKAKGVRATTPEEVVVGHTEMTLTPLGRVLDVLSGGAVSRNAERYNHLPDSVFVCR